jgi:hypothetical protein
MQGHERLGESGGVAAEASAVAGGQDDCFHTVPRWAGCRAGVVGRRGNMRMNGSAGRISDAARGRSDHRGAVRVC